MSPSDALPTAMKPSPGLPATAAQPRMRAIAPGRERLQSELLVWGWGIVALPLALLLMVVQLTIAWDNGNILGRMPIQAISISILLAGLAVALRAATPAAAAVGGIICYTTTLITTPASTGLSQTALPLLPLLFVLTFTATRVGHKRKAKLGLSEHHKGRDVSQIIANLGVASLLALFHEMLPVGTPACIAVLAEATADTVSSELGPLFPGRTRLLTNLQEVAPGTDGAVSVGGTLCGIAGAAVVTAAGCKLLSLDWLAAKIIFFSALFGFLADSLLGATLERRGRIGNDWVNFFSTAVTGALALGLGLWLIP